MRLSRNKPRFYLLLCTSLCFTSETFTQVGSDPLNGFDASIRQAVKDWNVPGLAIAVVHKGTVVFSNAYGVKRISKPDFVDTHTLFANASTTKAFTAMAIAMLVDEGKVKWDEPVVTYYPAFRLKDPYVTAEVTVRDLLTHRTGVVPTNSWVLDIDKETYIRNLRYAPRRSSTRSQFEYNNDMFVVAGEVIHAVSGKPWDQFVAERILLPVGMGETKMLTSGLRDSKNAVLPHAVVHGVVTEIPVPVYVDDADAAGSMNSNVTDMARWLQFLLDSARVNGKRLVQPKSFEELFRPQMLLSEPGYPAATQAGSHFFAYGLGWFLQDYKGHMLAMHTGSLDGLCAIIGLLPEENLGVVVFENVDHAELRHALMYSVFDKFLGSANKDWSKDLLQLYTARKVKSDSTRKDRESKRILGTHPTVPLEKYAGTYNSEIYGPIIVEPSPPGLTVRFKAEDRLTFDLIHWQHDVFKGTSRDAQHKEVMIQFRIDADGTPNEVRFDVYGQWTDEMILATREKKP
jgi:CubicO group peptidase (beta-lactamase class C family)